MFEALIGVLLITVVVILLVGVVAKILFGDGGG